MVKRHYVAQDFLKYVFCWLMHSYGIKQYQIGEKKAFDDRDDPQ